jgi:hypothetical protein
MTEIIGKVTLEDRLAEGPGFSPEADETENRLLEIVSSSPASEFPLRLTENPTWPLLTHLSPLREGLMNWIPLSPGQTVLELGAECGAVTGAFLGKDARVIASDASPVRCRINALRHRDAEGLTVVASSPRRLLASLPAPVDLVAWATAPDLPEPESEPDQKYTTAEQRFLETLRAIRGVLKPSGALYLAMENPLGLKYFSGRPEESTGRLYESIEGYPSLPAPRAYARRPLIRMAEEAGYDWAFYYPYPDHWFPEKIFTDECLPHPGELTRNWQCFSADRVIAFDEAKAFDMVIRSGLFPELSNAFLLRLSPKGGAES